MKTKATRRRMISCFAQIINGYVLGYKIPELVKNEKIKTRRFSYDSQMYLLMLGQFLRNSRVRPHWWGESGVVKSFYNSPSL